jgi:hypothetical protein
MCPLLAERVQGAVNPAGIQRCAKQIPDENPFLGSSARSFGKLPQTSRTNPQKEMGAPDRIALEHIHCKNDMIAVEMKGGMRLIFILCFLQQVIFRIEPDLLKLRSKRINQA